MWKKSGVPVLLTALAILSLPARAQDADNVADVRCVAVGVRFAVMADSTQKSIGTLIVLYYIGRLDGRAPTLDLEKLLTDQISKMTDADYSAEAMRCGQNLTAKGAQITHIGEDLQKRFNAAPAK